MHREFAVSIAFVFLLSSGIFAIDQIQSFDIYTSNVGVLRGEGTGAVASTNLATVTNTQNATNASGHIKVVQIGIGAVVQGGSAVGMDGLFGFEQATHFGGDQSQMLHGLFNLGLHRQNFSTDVGQTVFNIGTLGSAMALQNLVGSQSQFTITPYGVSVDVQCLAISLVDGAGGHNNAVISRGLSISRQFQVVN
ncbi:MAG: hypothetical protein ACYTBX_00960 [Planctomycetota bacterium]|jgi:hypothetical protein